MRLTRLQNDFPETNLMVTSYTDGINVSDKITLSYTLFKTNLPMLGVEQGFPASYLTYILQLYDLYKPYVIHIHQSWPEIPIEIFEQRIWQVTLLTITHKYASIIQASQDS